MAHTPDAKVKLRAAYIGGLDLESAARNCKIPLPTARNWFRAAKARGDDWDAFQRASMMVSGGSIEQGLGRIIGAAILRCDALMAELAKAETLDAIKAMAVLSDTISKLNAASKTFMQAADKRAIETDAIKRLADLFVKHHPADAGKMIAVLELLARNG